MKENIINYCPGLGSSNHLCLNFFLSCCPTAKSNKGYYIQFNKILEEIDWVEELQDLDVSQSWDKFLHHLCVAMDCHIPKCRELTDSMVDPVKWSTQ